MRLRALSDTRGAAAIEFAILAPVFLLIVFTMIGYGIYLAASHSVQQLTADAARTALAGLTESERTRLADDYIRGTADDYAFLDKNRFHVSVSDDRNSPNQFTVAISYDASALPIWNLYTFVMPNQRIDRHATIRIGGL
ncbi:TadE/TadG family type IV pilus assembly protein [Rhizobium halophytocola]|uniref:Flp pilus assembly protein TadG n=1 Tax=Rhizobium halophytocola TaxID=735519 RepID=A0ABS4DZ66_9HYPH|nr:TadE/TadG family type IV pilus assembly protein [Rhizobium halophytocola]MBP1850973.1 Flp pilus assembly protein TadG [Rhizobium halophytocola]